MAQGEAYRSVRDAKSADTGDSEQRRIEIDDRLDRMYNRSMRCPYCKAKILKYTTTCERCGVHKKQILDASNKKAKDIRKQKTGEKIFISRHRPDDVNFVTMAVLLIFGLFGVHNFYAGRKIRGLIMILFVAVGCMFFGIFPVGTPGEDGRLSMHPVRENFENMGILFPTDFLVAIALIMWAYDAFAVVLGFYKYPIRLADKPQTVEAGKNEKKK